MVVAVKPLHRYLQVSITIKIEKWAAGSKSFPSLSENILWQSLCQTICLLLRDWEAQSISLRDTKIPR